MMLAAANEVFDDFAKNLSFDCWTFAPELIVVVAIVGLLGLRLLPGSSRTHVGGLTLALILAGIAAGVAQWMNVFDLGASSRGSAHRPFGGLVAYDNFTIFIRLFLLGFAGLLTWLTMLTGIPDGEDSADFYCLLLGATLGMMLMASANHLLMVFIAVEMASLPSYALAGFLKGRRQSSEAALKYVVYGGGAAGIMLFGISLLAGRFGTGYLPDLAYGFATAVSQARDLPMHFDPVVLLGTFFIVVGFSFKLAAVPFQFWCPDVFEGAAAEVAAFLSVASKGAALALTGRFAFMIVGLGGESRVDYHTWLEVARYLGPALAVLAGLTATFGNLAAFPQTNLKRLLAYSTIAHAGYMLMGLAPLNKEGASAVLYYLVAYLVMNLGAFAIVAFLRNETGSEDLSSYRGMIQRSPIMTVLLAIFLLSLLGIPPLAGFAAKVQIFLALFHAGQNYSAGELPGLGYTMYVLLVVGGVNTVFSAVYYLKVLKTMILDAPEETAASKPVKTVPAHFGASLYGIVLGALILLVFYPGWNILEPATQKGMDRFQDAPKPTRLTAEVRP